MQISPTEAVKIFRVARATLYKHMGKGVVSYEIDPTGNKILNVAELERVYERRAVKIESEQVNTGRDGVHHTDLNIQGSSSNKENELLREIIKSKDDEIERWRFAHEEAQKNVREALTTVKLLEDKSNMSGANVIDEKINELAEKFEHRFQEKTGDDDKYKELSNKLELQLQEKAEEEKKRKETEERLRKLEEKNDRVLKAFRSEKQKREEAEKQVKEEQSKGFWKRLVG